MKKLIAVLVLASLIMSSCSSSMSPFQAASSRQRCGHGTVR